MVEGFLRMMDTDTSVTGPINLGNPTEFTIRQLADQIVALTGSKSPLDQRPLPQDDPKQRQPDISKAMAVLEWQPTVSLEDGLVRTIDYFHDLLPTLRLS